MLKVKINDKQEYEVELEQKTVTINGQEHKPDLAKISDTQYHLLLNNKSYRISIQDKTDDKHLTISVNGNPYTVAIQDKFDLLLHDLGMDTAMSAKADNLKAPMPGLVVNILVEPGEEVSKDTPLVVLEAMKMENMLKATAHGVVDAIKVNVRDAVEKNQVLITFR
jgi:biotin carboxyl carrier protein